MSEEEMDVEPQICRIKLSSKLKKRAPALIADFDHSRVTSNALEFASFKAETDKDKPDAERTLHARSHHTLYKGCTSKEAVHFRTFVGVLNKATGKMKVYDSAIFRMKPVLKSAEADTASQVPASKTYWEGINDLSENFGIKKSKRAMSERLKWTQDSSSIDEKLNFADLSLNSTPTTPQFGSKDIEYLPTKNQDALSVDQVYDINEIISPEEQYALEGTAHRLLNVEGDELSKMRSGLCKYVIDHLNNTDISVEKAKLLIYYDYLIKFQHVKYADLRKKDLPLDIPQPFKQRIIETFTQESKSIQNRSARLFPQHMKDKLISYLIVLALFIDDFVVNSTRILNDLNKVGLPKFVLIAQAIGCHIKAQKIENETVKFAELKLPLYVIARKHIKKSRT